ncbi:MAG: type VI secretion system baseplate subunit TssG [Desulfobacteraceae bacterium]|nr:type VI secretion system baseplate subunit TssG [Desulfobacteraceae bacterium]
MSQSAHADIIGQLLDRGRAFSFFQAVRLLRHAVKGRRSDDAVAMSEMIRVRPELSLAFPAADIDCIEQTVSEDGHDIFRITATFLGLYGTSSPLPTFYTEELLEGRLNDETVTRSFLDILNQRLYELLYQGWLKYRTYFQVTEENDSQHLERLYCLLGLGSEPLRRSQGPPGFDYRLLRYIGLLTQFPRSASGLETLLKDALRDVPLRIVPCIHRIAKIPERQQLRLGRCGCQLGMNSYVGDEIEDRMGYFRIRVGPLDQAGFLRFTPGQENYALLTALTEIYTIQPLAYEVELVLAAHQAKTVCLGDPIRSVLGVTTWVFSREHLGEVSTRFKVSRD